MSYIAGFKAVLWFSRVVLITDLYFIVTFSTKSPSVPAGASFQT